jgi:hypothetical protein
VHLGVGLQEADVGQALLPAEPAGMIEHLRGEVDAQRAAGHGGAGGVPRGLAGAAADVKHPVVRSHVRGGAEPLVVRAGLGVEHRGVPGPVRTGRPVPLGRLRGVGARPGCLRFGHVRVSSPRL